MFKEDAFVDRIMKFEIYDRIQTFELILAMFIAVSSTHLSLPTTRYV